MFRKIVAIVFAWLLIAAPVLAAPPGTPRVWLDAQALALSDNDPVATWADGSGNALDFTEATNRPTYKTNVLNGHPCVRFDGTNDILSNASVDLVQPITIALKFALLSTTGTQESFFSGNNFLPLIYKANSNPDTWAYYATAAIDSGVVIDTNFNTIVATFNGASSTLRLNGSQIAASNPGTSGATAKVAIGAAIDSGGTPSEFSDIDICEVLIYDGTESATGIESYFTAHWAVAGGACKGSLSLLGVGGC
jgi:hypothetical protein